MTGIVGLIPAAGKGERLGLPYPKELHAVPCGKEMKPIIEYAVDMLKDDVKEIIIVLRRDKLDIAKYLGSGERYRTHFSYVIQEWGDTLGDACQAASHLTQGKAVAFVMPDTIIQPKDAIRELIFAIQDDDDIAMGLFPVKNYTKFGMVDYKNGMVTRLIDKPIKTALTHAWGCLVWGPKFTGSLERLGMNKALDKFITLRTARAVPFDDGRYVDIGTVEELREYLKETN